MIVQSTITPRNDYVVLRETWKEWETNGEKQQQVEGIGDCL